ncbi:UDP-N-acetylmuramoyl-tripeptide--D-alanyl-D-alanine ligase [Ideonella sp. BN130291]|uniref:UDP-N-acetylmuramoyl-tripeptide--D-alanyl-D- alanine ligase n=1 Tax=Ideonella sp. BN130291 TaxID=3112940 RepID=UPI003FA57839
MMTLADAHALLPGATLVGDGTTAILRVHSDTRSLKPGDLFVALKGERFDAHDFLPQAGSLGAVAALAERGLHDAGLPGLQVPDALAGLQALASGWRDRFVLPLIAVTGSNGKTTVTQMIASILRAWVPQHAFSTEGNLNNHIGVPLTLLRLRQDESTWHKAGVIELGMNHVGEIAELSRLVKPTVALVNNAQREHQEFMASVEAVARENGSVIEALGPTGVAVFPADDEYAPLWHTLAGQRPQLTFAMHGAADVTGTEAWDGDAWALTLHTPVGTTLARLKVAGRHNLKNALAAATCALAAGAPLEAIASGLEAFEAVKGRSQLKSFERAGRRVTLVDDSYNANPDSVRAAIDVLAELPAPQWLVLGDMGEVGTQGPQFHAEVGAYARERGLPALWTAGSLCADAAAAYGTGARHFATVPELLAALGQAPEAAAVLVKGSRFMQMERVVQALLAAASSSSSNGAA